MSRDMTPTMQAAVAAEVLRPVTLVKISLDSGIIAVHSALGDIAWNGHTYLGVGNMGNLSEIHEGNSIAPYGIRATLSGIPAAMISTVLGEHYQGRPAEVYLALLDEAYELLVDPTLAFRGRCDFADIQLGEQAAIQLTIKSRLADWQRPRIRRFNHEDQQAVYPGDLGLEYVAKMVEKPIVWGRG
jgi:hypothetical protein